MRWSDIPKRLAITLVPTLAYGCAAPPAAKAPIVSEHRKDTWAEYELVGDGVFARFPTAPQETGRSSLSRGTSHALSSNGTTSFYCGRVAWPGGRIPSQEQLGLFLGKLLGRGTTAEAPRLHGFPAANFTGTDHEGNSVRARVYLVGDGMIVARVWNKGNDVNQATATRFFDSIRLTIPWRIRTIPEVGLSVAVPAWAIDNSKGPTRGSLPWTAEAPTIAVIAGGTSNVLYTAAGGVNTAWPEASSDASLLERAAAHISGTDKVLSSEVIEYEGTPGRDMLLLSAQGYAHVRIFAVHGSFYTAYVASNAEERVHDDDAKRFLDSLRWYEPDCPAGMRLDGANCTAR